MKEEKKTSVRTQRLTVTPFQASNWLTKNINNRPLRERYIGWLAKQIKAGRWMLTTDSIGFDTGGNLINGQHRLHAIVRANKDVELLVTHGMNPDAFNTIDTGMMRNAGDILGVHGFKVPKTAAAIVKFVLAYNKGITTTAVKGGGDVRSSNQEILDFSSKHKAHLEDTLDIMQHIQKEFKGLPGRLLGGLYFILSNLHRDQALLFFQTLSTGIGVKADDPVYQLRKRLIEDMSSKKKFADKDKVALTILAWNHYRAGNKITKLQWAGDGKTSFPKPK